MGSREVGPKRCGRVVCVPSGLSMCSIVYVSIVRLHVKDLFRGRYSGPVEEGSRIIQKSMLKFTWTSVAGDVNQSCEVRLLCRDAARRGVPPPKHWKNDLKFGRDLQAMEALADSAIRRVRDEFALAASVKLDCRLRSTHARAIVREYNVCVCCTLVAGTLESVVLLQHRVPT